MIFTFEALPMDNKEIVKTHILDLFGRDIATARCQYSMYMYEFIFSEGRFPAIIRVEKEMPHNTMEDMLCELMWIDDLKNDIPNICQPLPSRGNRLVERITAGETVYLAAMFRKANGAIATGAEWDASFFYKAGALLGKIHRTSSEGYQRGFRYKRKHWDELPYYDFSYLEGHFAPQIQQAAQALLLKIKSIPRDPRWYGMTHGQFYNESLYCDWGDMWVTNFSACCYGYFIFDIMSMVNLCVENQGYAARFPHMTPRDRLFGEEGILVQLRAGYSSEYHLPDAHWDMTEDLIRLDAAITLTATIIYDVFRKDLMIAYGEARLLYLKDDTSAIDKIDTVAQNLIASLTPEQKKVIETEMPWIW